MGLLKIQKLILVGRLHSPLSSLDKTSCNQWRYFHTSNIKLNFYTILGVSRDADQKEIKQAFRKKSLECHPDKFPGDEIKEKSFKEISEAYQTLSDKKLKFDYDSKNSPQAGAHYGKPGGGRSAGFGAEGWEDQAGQYHGPRSGHQRFQYTYTAAGTSEYKHQTYRERKYKNSDQKTANQRSEEFMNNINQEAEDMAKAKPQLMWVDYFVRGIVASAIVFFFYKAYKTSTDISSKINKDSDEELRRQLHMDGAKQYHHRNLELENLNSSNNIYDQRARIYRERLRAKQAEIDRQIAEKDR